MADLPPQPDSFLGPLVLGSASNGSLPPNRFFFPDYTGIITLGCCVAVLLGYLAHCWVHRVLDRRGRMSEIHAGALRYAAAQGNLVALSEIEKRAAFFDVDVAREGFTALHAASIQGHAAAAEWLLARGADTKLLKDDGWQDTALHYAAANGHTEAAAVLLAYGADPLAENFEKCKPHDLAKRGAFEDLASLLERAALAAEEKKKVTQPEQSLALMIGPSSPGNFGREVEELDTILNDAAEGIAMAQIRSKFEKPKAITPELFVEYATGKIGEEDVNKELGGNLWDPAKRKATPGWRAKKTGLEPMSEKEIKALMSRGWEGYRSDNTYLRKGWRLFQVTALATQFLGILYFVWRACRTFNPNVLWYSVIFYVLEFVSFIPSFIFVLEVWQPIERKPRNLKTMKGLQEEDYPTVDVLVPCYSEPADIVEATACAALNIEYPASKLTVYICDDGRRDDIRAMAHRLEFQRRFLKRQAPLVYVCRTKVKGVPHHAKAGNINNCLLKAGSKGDFAAVFDCDMVAKTEFLHTTIPHFYNPSPGGGWEPKEKAAFIQIPQDFFNLVHDDPFGNRARFFYGPMMQGRDGVGSCPCVGTGVIFRREALISLGGQAYGSITEDYNSAMALLGAGFSSMYLNDRLIFGIAPDDIVTVLVQRLRWAMGSLQILCRENPLLKSGLSTPQSMLFYQSAIQYCLSLPTIIMAIIPVLYLFIPVSPIYAKVHEFLVFFIGYYTCNRIMLFLAHRGVQDGQQEMWRGSQMWVWLAPNNLQACYKTFTTELSLFKFLGVGKLGFAVTNKGGNEDIRKVLWLTWPFLAYYIALAAGVIFRVIKLSLGSMTVQEAAAQLVALAWAVLICLYVWPPVTSLAPKLFGPKGETGEVLWQQRVEEENVLKPELQVVAQKPTLGRSFSMMSDRSGRRYAEAPAIRDEDQIDPEDVETGPRVEVWKNARHQPRLGAANVLEPGRDESADEQLELLYSLVTGQVVETPRGNKHADERRVAAAPQARHQQLDRLDEGVEYPSEQERDVDLTDTDDDSLLYQQQGRRSRRCRPRKYAEDSDAMDDYPSDYSYSSRPLDGAIRSVRRIADEASDYEYSASDGSAYEERRSGRRVYSARSNGSQYSDEAFAKAPSEEAPSEGQLALERFKERMSQRVVFNNVAAITSKPDFRFTTTRFPHLTFVIVNGALLAGFITGGLVYIFLMDDDHTWLGIH